MKPGKACGPDNIPGRVLRDCAIELTPSLTALFNASLSLGKVPSQWKLANVAPVFKKGDSSCVENYRPISLLSLVSKVLERCIHKQILPHILPMISDNQHGFLPGHSCTTQLVEFIHDLASNYDRGVDTDVVYLDFSKAFDSVNHYKLFGKLRSTGFGGPLLEWFQDYLSDRLQRVAINGDYSGWLHVTSGVPQGSILGPLLFVIYINDLPTSVKSKLVMFADDAKCYRPIVTVDDQLTMQSDLNVLQKWSKTWDLDFNAKKCVILHVNTRKHHHLPPYNYKLGEHSLTEVDQQNDLGIIVSNNLDWKPHIRQMICKANRILGMIRYTCFDIHDVQTRKILYLAHVRPLLEYSSEIWNPITKGLAGDIERVQRKATRFILRSSLPYEDRLKELNLLSLEQRRLFKDNILFFKGIHNLTTLDVPGKIYFRSSDSYTLRSSDCLSIIPNKCRTNIFSQSFFNRICKSWNDIPVVLRNTTNPLYFKNQLLNHYYEQT